MLGSLGTCRHSSKTVPTWSGVGRYMRPRVRGRLRRAFRRARDFPGDVRNFPRGPARWICAIYLDFPGSVGILLKRALRGAGGWGDATPGHPADRVGSSGNREISRRISETAPCPPRGEFAPFTWLGFSRSVGIRRERRLHGAGGVGICDRRIRGRSQRIFRKSRDSQPCLTNCFRATARWI